MASGGDCVVRSATPIASLRPFGLLRQRLNRDSRRQRPIAAQIIPGECLETCARDQSVGVSSEALAKSEAFPDVELTR